MSLMDTWNNLPTWGKWGIGIGIGGLLLYIIMHKSNSSASTMPTLTSDTSSPTLGSDVMGGGSSNGSYDPGNQNGSQNNGASGIGSSGGTSSTGSGGTSVPIVTQNPVPVPAPPPAVSTTPTTPTTHVVTVSNNNPKNKDSNYTPIYVSNVSQDTAFNIANQNPGSPVNVIGADGSRVGYAVSKAASNGTTDYTSNNYNSAVNAAGGQWLNHTFYSGSYTNSGSFVTKDSNQQSTYNNIVKDNPAPQATSNMPNNVVRNANGSYSAKNSLGGSMTFSASEAKRFGWIA